mmetsp:Transcript_2804/g.6254  ORF Transcript_2804/g.6254 Transcript_2804/m.6254 type:complete len:208 (+) Transcript_2804:416-1039(+)
MPSRRAGSRGQGAATHDQNRANRRGRRHVQRVLRDADPQRARIHDQVRNLRADEAGGAENARQAPQARGAPSNRPHRGVHIGDRDDSARRRQDAHHARTQRFFFALSRDVHDRDGGRCAGALVGPGPAPAVERDVFRDWNLVLRNRAQPGSGVQLRTRERRAPRRDWETGAHAGWGGGIQGVKHVQEAVTSLPDRLHQIVPRLLQTN